MAKTKSDLIQAVAKSCNVPKKSAETMVETFLGCIIEALNNEDDVELRGFGSFRIRERSARRARNPRTGDPVEVEPKYVPVFRVGKQLKDAVNARRKNKKEKRRPS